MGWSGEHRGFVVETFFKNNESVIATQRAFRRHFRLGQRAPIPDRKMILLWVSNVRATGSTLKRRPPVRPRSVRTPENVQTVRASIEQSPRRSTRKHAAALGISNRSVRRMLHQELGMPPYKMMLAQELSERDWETRRTLCQEVQQHVPRAAVALFSDEAHIYLCGPVNKQNFQYWTVDNPRELHERPLRSPYVTVWCAIAEFGMWGPYFFMLQNFLWPKLDELEEKYVWFQQDGATTHTSCRSLSILREVFPGHLISLRGDIGWPARSPDLTPCDFFSLGIPKS